MKKLKISIEISRELVSAVLGLNVVYTESCEHRDGIVGIWTDINSKPIEEINIYEFAFKCKEWAINKGYQIISGLSDEPAYRSSDEKAYAKINHYSGDSIDNLKCKYKIIMANTEVEAVINASEYALKEIK